MNFFKTYIWKTGEKTKWQWGLPKENEKDDTSDADKFPEHSR